MRTMMMTMMKRCPTLPIHKVVNHNKYLKRNKNVKLNLFLKKKNQNMNNISSSLEKNVYKIDSKTFVNIPKATYLN